MMCNMMSSPITLYVLRSLSGFKYAFYSHFPCLPDGHPATERQFMDYSQFLLLYHPN